MPPLDLLNLLFSIKKDSLINKIKDIYTYWFIEGESERRFNNDRLFNLVSLINNDMCNLIKSGIDKFEGKKDYFSTSEVNGHNYQCSGRKITFYNRESRANMQPVKYSVWFAKMKYSVKHIAFGENSYLQNKIILSTGFAGLKCTPYAFAYIWSLVNTNLRFEKTKDNNATGSTQEAINEDGLNYINIKHPTLKCLMEYSKIVTPMIEMIYKLKEQNEIIQEIKSDLINKFIV